jgi:hypothetical protein
MEKGLKNNIQFNYLYRDAGNFKKFGSVVFANPDNLSVKEIGEKISENLIDFSYFRPDSIGIPPLFFEKYIEALDHSWNEFENVESTMQPATDERTITQFIEKLIAVREASFPPRRIHRVGK